MRVDQKPGAKSINARMAGLGISTAVALTVLGAVPAVAVADETIEPVIEDATNADTSKTGEDESAAATEIKTGEAISSNEGNNWTEVSSTTSNTRVDVATTVDSDTIEGVASSTVYESDTTDASGATSQILTDSEDESNVAAADEDDEVSQATEVATDVEIAPAEANSTDTISVIDKEANTVSSALDNVLVGTASQNTSLNATATKTVNYYNMYRLYNPNSGEHFYTANLNEAKNIVSVGWRWENVGWVAPSSGVAVYRLYNPNAGDHHYTTSAGERDYLSSVGWKYEGVGWYSDTAADAISVLRAYNPNAQTGTHHFTTSVSELKTIVAAGWRDEGIGWYASNHSVVDIGQGFWIVTSSWGSQERYWIASNGTIAYNRRIDASQNSVDAGAGYVAYATTNRGGAVVRGAWANSSGYVYIANNDGKLIEYSDGAFHDLNLDMGVGTQSYYFDKSGSGKSGLFTHNGKTYYAVPGGGYIVKNKTSYLIGDKTYNIDSAGVVTEVQLSAAILSALRYANQITNQYGMWRDLFITVSHNTHTFYVWQGSAGNLSYVWSSSCTLGKPSTPTQYGYNYLNDPQEVFQGARYAVKYAGHDHGEGWHIHSTLLSESASSQLGRDVSNGCIRIPIDRAKWLYDKVKSGYGGWGWSKGINLYVY